MKIIIVRHGETVGNNLGITQGQNHGKLSKLGLKQVEKLANYLKNEKIDSVYCSDLNRCKECGLIFINPQPSNKELSKHYPSKEYYSLKPKFPRKIKIKLYKTYFSKESNWYFLDYVTFY